MIEISAEEHYKNIISSIYLQFLKYDYVPSSLVMLDSFTPLTLIGDCAKNEIGKKAIHWLS